MSLTPFKKGCVLQIIPLVQSTTSIAVGSCTLHAATTLGHTFLKAFFSPKEKGTAILSGANNNASFSFFSKNPSSYIKEDGEVGFMANVLFVG